MFEKLFRKSKNQIDAADTGLQTVAQEDHGTIAAAPQALALLRSSKEASEVQLPPETASRSEDKIHDDCEQRQSQPFGAREIVQPATSSFTKPWQRHRHACVPVQGHANEQKFAVASIQQLQQKADDPAEHLVSGEAEQAFVASAVLPALCQVTPSAEYTQQKKQHIPNHQSQQSMQPLLQPLWQSTQSYQPAISNVIHQQVEQISMPHSPATLDYGSWLQQQRQQQQQPLSIEALQQKLLLEAKAREELEDMLLRYERHLTAARLAAEQQAAAALNHAADYRQQMVSNGRQAKQQNNDLAAEQAAVQQERAELEQMRSDFEAQLQTARSELAKAKAALSSNEDRVRAAEAEERAQLVAEYELRLSGMMSEVESLREEVARRTQLLTTEMERWKRQATLNAAAVIEAKNEVLDRKRELDSTKDKMEHLINKLYAGREANLSLSGAIEAAANYQQASTNQFLAQKATSMSSLAGGRSCMAGTAAAAVMAKQMSQAGSAAHHLENSTRAHDSTAGFKAVHRASAFHNQAASKALVPTMHQRTRSSQVAAAAQLSPHHVLQHMGSIAADNAPLQFLSVGGAPGMAMQQQQHQAQPRSSLAAVGSSREPPHLQALTSPSKNRNTSRIPQPAPTAAKSRIASRIPQPAPTAAVTDHGSTTEAFHLPGINSKSAHQPTTKQERSPGTSRSKAKKDQGGSYAQLHRQQHLDAHTLPTHKLEDDAYGHVTSRYAQPVATGRRVLLSPAKSSTTQKHPDKKKQLPDRFAEGARNAAMIAAMAHKFG